MASLALALAVPFALVWIIRKGAWWERSAPKDAPQPGYRARRPC